MVSVEALAGWYHPELGNVPPTTFIPLAEETGLIHRIGPFILHEACRQAQTWLERYGPDTAPVVSVNVSTLQIRHGEIVTDVVRALKETGLPARHLRLEINESAMLRNVDEKVEIFRVLNQLGVRLTLDDFGTGYSSMAHLMRLPMDTIKLDRTFVRDLDSNEEAQIVARGLVQLIRSLRLCVVAEGIETLSQRSMLVDYGAEYGQGYLFSKPVSGDELALQLDLQSVSEPVDQSLFDLDSEPIELMVAGK
jgi:EAL domain-containing protein (putative c-di-GMP-specific phosphodiesterase class I)